MPPSTYDEFLDYLCRQIPARRMDDDLVVAVVLSRRDSVDVPIRSAVLRTLYADVCEHKGRAFKTALRDTHVALAVECGYVAQRSDRFEISDW